MGWLWGGINETAEFILRQDRAILVARSRQSTTGALSQQKIRIEPRCGKGSGTNDAKHPTGRWRWLVPAPPFSVRPLSNDRETP